ncbi:hypothetical protein B0H19DRAFT_143173 [Mycena capillaripes]|nr:hypothetical protein B0H19DRAFT_143173 [Mycena capillaripes]
MTHQPNFAPADFSILSSNEPQNSEIDGAGNPASSPTTVTDSEWASNAEDVGSRPSGGSGVTIAPPQVPDPTHRLTGNYDNALRDNLHSGTDVGSPFLSTQQNTLTFDDSSPAPSFLESSLTAQPPATPNYYPETSSHGHLSYPAHLRLTPNEARPQIDDLHDGIQHASVPPIQAAIRRDAPPVLPFVAHGAGERFEDAWPWLTTGTERDGVALMHRIAHKFRLQVNIAPAPPSVSWLPPSPSRTRQPYTRPPPFLSSAGPVPATVRRSLTS